MSGAFLKLLKNLRNSFLWIWEQKGSPAQRARGIAVGVFSGCFPLFGFQSFIGLGLASLFKANHLLALTGTWISNPLTYIPLYWFNYKVGAFCLDQDPKLLQLKDFSQTDIWKHGWFISSRILLGSSIVGLFASMVTGLIFYMVFRASLKKDNFI